MKTLKLLLITFTVLFSLQLKAQYSISGTVILMDSTGKPLPDMSGTKVIFSSEGAPAKSDTAYTDSSGYYVDTLKGGSYGLYIYNSGFDSLQIFGLFISSGPSSIPNDTLYPEKPETAISNQTLKGTLIAYTHYGCDGNLQDITIDAGDTLVIPEGCWLRNINIAVNGCLIMQGTPSNPILWFGADASYGGYSFSNTGISAMSMGSIILSNVLMPGVYLSGGNINLSNVNLDYTLFPSISPLFDISNVTSLEGDVTNASLINISESNFSGDIAGLDFTPMTVTCTNLNSGSILVSNGSTLDFEDNYGGIINAFNAGNLVLKNNYFVNAYALDLEQESSSIDTVEVVNNSFAPYSSGPSVYIDSGNCNLTLINNLGINFGSANLVSHATITDCEYNIIVPQFGEPELFLPVGLTPPAGVANPYVVAGTTVDTTDSLHNTFLNQIRLFSPCASDAALQHTGDPALTNPDGSRSNIGAVRDTATCSNSFIPNFQACDTTVADTVIDSVYPGDANYDGICNNLDVLPIGLIYNQTGPIRTGASLVWVGQYATPWADSLTNPSNKYVNDKHVDCNGDGVINYNDVNAIYQNYSLTHPVVPKTSSYGAGLWLQFPIDSVFEGDTMMVAVMLGTPLQAVDSVYGLAFSINYDQLAINDSVAGMTFNNSWIGTDTVNMISFFKSIPSQNRYDVAVSRTDKQPITGSGQIGSLIVVINDDIQGKDSIFTSAMNFSGIYAIDEHENVLNIGGDEGSFNVLIGKRYEGIQQMVSNSTLSVYPNPANDQLIISTKTGVSGKATLYSVEGQAMLLAELKNENQAMDISMLNDGLYILKVDIQGKTICRKVVIAR